MLWVAFTTCSVKLMITNRDYRNNAEEMKDEEGEKDYKYHLEFVNKKIFKSFYFRDL